MMNMKLLSVVTPTSIYHGCFTWNTFWEENLAVGEFSAVDMKNCGPCNVRKHREIKGRDRYAALDISLNFGSMDKMRITYSYPKDNLVRSGKGLINYLGLKAKSRPKKYKKARYSIGNITMKDLSKIIKDFEKLPYKIYERKSPKHKPTNSYNYLARQLAKCMTRSDALNSHIYPVRMEMTSTK